MERFTNDIHNLQTLDLPLAEKVTCMLGGDIYFLCV